MEVNIVSMEIDEDVKKCTIKCNKDMSCLSDKGNNLCKVVRSTSGDIIFIECMEYSPCNYKMSFGFSSFICNCPTRKEIYKKYGV